MIMDYIRFYRQYFVLVKCGFLGTYKFGYIWLSTAENRIWSNMCQLLLVLIWNLVQGYHFKLYQLYFHQKSFFNKIK